MGQLKSTATSTIKRNNRTCLLTMASLQMLFEFHLGSLIANWTLFMSLLKKGVLFVAGIRMEHDQQKKTFRWTETGLNFTQVRPSAGPFCLDSTVTNLIHHSGIKNRELLRSLIVWSKSLNLLNSLGIITSTGSFSKRGVYWRNNTHPPLTCTAC